MTCTICGDEITPPERAEIKNYCKKPSCVRAGMRRIEMALIKNGKAGFDVQLAEYARPVGARGGFMDGRRKV